MMLRHATMDELPGVCDLYRAVCDGLLASGVNQWRWGEYPAEDMLREDIALRQLYVLEEDGDLAAAVCVNQEQDPEYDGVAWAFGVKPGSFHRLAIHPAQQGKGLVRKVMAGVEEILLDQGCDCLRIDTYAENTHAQHVYEKAGMRRAGEVHFAHRPLAFVCFEKALG